MKIYEYRIPNIIRYLKINEYRIVLFGPNYSNNRIIELFVATLNYSLWRHPVTRATALVCWIGAVGQTDFTHPDLEVWQR